MIPTFNSTELTLWVMTACRKRRMIREGMEKSDTHLLYCQICYKILKIHNDVATYQGNNYHWLCFRKALGYRLTEQYNRKIADLEKKIETLKIEHNMSVHQNEG